MSELRKQIKDQFWHFVWGYPTGASMPVGYWGLDFPGLIAGTGLAVLSWYVWTMREGHQREDGSHVWWDPYLDSLVFFLAVGIGFVTMFRLLIGG